MKSNIVTKRNTKKNIKSITKKNYFNSKYSFKKLLKNNSLFASKKVHGQELLEFTKNNEIMKKQICLIDNLSWFGNYKVAKSYQTHETKIYEWKIKKITKLLIINEKNNVFFYSLFHQNLNKIKLDPAIILSKENSIELIQKNLYNHPYIYMNNNERAYYEFCFVFGYITIEEQYNFMKLLKYLLQKEFIVMKTRDGKSILNKLFIKINYYKLSHLFYKKKLYNRLSFYELDKYAVLNICKLIKWKNLPISGIYQGNNESFWFPNIIIYKMNIEETILFNPHHNLIFEKEIN